MESSNHHGDGPGGSSRESYERFERWWGEMKASMSAAEFEAWREKHSAKPVSPHEVTAFALKSLTKTIGESMAERGLNVRRPARFINA